MFCDFNTTPLSGGQFRHVCRRPGCGRDFVAAAAAVTVRCRAHLKSAISNSKSETNPKLQLPIAPVKANLEICRACLEHAGTGCWRDREYGCQREYREAAALAARTAACPIGKLGKLFAAAVSRLEAAIKAPRH
jgi:hypothetical protein